MINIDAILFLLIIIVIGVMPWINLYKIKKLNDTIKQLTKLLSQKTQNPKSLHPDEHSNHVLSEQSSSDDYIPENKNNDNDKIDPFVETTSAFAHDIPAKPERGNFEQRFGARIQVWIGGIALALSGFYLVKYSIENYSLSPEVRVLFSLILGITLLFSSKLIHNIQIANGERISQALSGAGIAVLYFVSFAAVRLYELVPVFVGFMAMAGVTVTALVLSLRHGAPIAMLGMAGGFITPALLGSNSADALTLFIYLYFTTTGLLVVIRNTKYWWLSIPTIIASFIWVIFWLKFRYAPGDSLWLGLFLMGISISIVMMSKYTIPTDNKNNYALGNFSPSNFLSYIGIGGALLIMSAIAGSAGFGIMEWSLFGCMSLGGIILAYFNDKLYGFVPIVSVIINIIMLSNWNTHDSQLYALILVIFALLYLISSCILIFKTMRPILWTKLYAITVIGYYLLTYYKLHSTYLFANLFMIWGIIGLVLSMFSLHILLKIHKKLTEHPHKDKLYAILALTCSALFSLALAIEIDKEFLSIAFVCEILAIAWINQRVSISTLRPIAGLLAGIFVYILYPQLTHILVLILNSILLIITNNPQTMPILTWPLFQLTFPAIMFLCSAYLFKTQSDGKLVRAFEYIAIYLIALSIYIITRNLFTTDQNILSIKAGFLERGVITNLLFILSLGCFWIGRKYQRISFSSSAATLCLLSIIRVIYFDILTYNAWWSSQKIEGLIILNSLIVSFGIIIIWAYLSRKELLMLERPKLGTLLSYFMLVMIFTLLTLNVRHIFHGEFLNLGITTNAEIYAYSVIWMLLGIGLLFAGILQHNKTLRHASLGIIFLTIGKVFIYDAAELEGLYRVLSFFGLGISLLLLSYFYSRFVKEK